MNKDRAEIVEEVLAIAEEAARIVMRVYALPFDVDYKGVDDPVTRADREANAFLCKALRDVIPGAPIVAEESDPAEYAGFGNAEATWFVDPLDGTREFVAKNGEFAVMIGLAERGAATLGVMVCPAEGRTYAGIVGGAAFELGAGGARKKLVVSTAARLADARVVVSRSHRGPKMEAALAKMAPRLVVPTGGSGIKAARVVSAEADVYLQPGNAGKRWDACAPEAIVRAAGGAMTDITGRSFEYSSGELENSRGLIATNGLLHEATLAAIQASFEQ